MSTENGGTPGAPATLTLKRTGFDGDPVVV
jgi:hypothetical protein